MKKLIIQNIEGNIIPWKSQEELSQRISESFKWARMGDPIPGKLTYISCGYSGIFPQQEIKAIITQLPKEHEINQEIIKQANGNLIEIINKSSNELMGHNPKYSNSFYVGEVAHFDELFEVTKNATYHIVNTPVLTKDALPKEDEIMFAAARGMQGYMKKKPAETLEFFNGLKDKELVLPNTLVSHMEFEDPDIIKTYFNLFNHAKGNDEFVLNGIERNIPFKFMAKRLKRYFPTYDFKKEMDRSDPRLRGQLKNIFS